VIGAGGFKSDEDRRLKGLQPLLQCDVITMTIHHAPPLSASLWRFNHHLMRLLRDINRHQDDSC
jgi:hypothetical protein